MITTPGKILVGSVLPEKYKGTFTQLDEDALGDLATRIAKEDPEKYIDIIHGLQTIAKEVTTTYGHGSSIKLEDLRTPPELQQHKRRVQAKVNQIINDPRYSAAQKKKQITDYMLEELKRTPGMVKDVMNRKDTGFAFQLQSGARGNPSALTQTMIGDLMLADADNKPVPLPSVHGYGEGLTPLEYWAAANGSRKGVVDVQFATADSGYLGKQLNNLGHRTIVTEKDCGTTNGLPVEGGDIDNIGSVLANPVGNIPAGTVINKQLLPKLEGKDIVVRSLVSCQAKEGVCSKCSGKREDNEFPILGEVVGAVAARAMAEPITQAALSTKHSGGVAGQDTDKISGFQELNQFLQVPKVFRGGAVLAQKDGLVSSIKSNPAGTGKLVTVDNEEHYVPNENKLLVKKGQRLNAGDVLSEGIPNPAELTYFKGVGEGRRYFVNQYRKMLDKNKGSVHRRNIEALARSFINRVQVDKPEGYDGYIIGDVVPYDDFVRDYKPRENSEQVSLNKARSGYLEQPVLHYSIGTKITSGVLDDLSKHKINSILINKEPPPFRPKVVRSVDFLKTDPDWMTRMGGEGLQKSLLQAVHQGGTSKAGGTSYFPTVADATKLKRIDKEKI